MALQVAIQMDPKLSAAHERLGFTLWREQAFEAAAESYRKAIELDPRNAAAQAGLRRVRTALTVLDAIYTFADLRVIADFSQTVLGDDNGIGGFQGSNEDFFPKTVVVAGEWRKTLFHFPWIFAAEIMDYQLKSSLFTPNPAFHTQAMRVGVECGIAEGTQLRLGSDRGDLSFGFGYAFPWHRRRPVQFDYALLLERGWTTFNPYAVGLKILF